MAGILGSSGMFGPTLPYQLSGGLLNQPPTMAGALAPQAGVMGGIQNWFQQNPQLVSALAAGLMSGNGTRGALANATQAIGPGMKADQENNAFNAFLDSPEAKAVNPGLLKLARVSPQARALVMANMFKKDEDKTPDITNYRAYVKDEMTAGRVPKSIMAWKQEWDGKADSENWSPLLAPEERAKFGIDASDKRPALRSTRGDVKFPGSAATSLTLTNNLGPTGIDYGKPEEGLVWARDENGKVKTDERGAAIAVPYQGGSVYRKQADAEKKGASVDTERAVGAAIVTQDIDRIIDIAEKSPIAVTGIFSLAKAIPGTPQSNVAAMLNTVKAKVGFDKLQQMRESSPTGGALGQVSDFENRLLQSTMGALEQEQSKEQFVFNLRRVQAVYNAVINGVVRPDGKVEKLSADNVKDVLAGKASGAPAATGAGPLNDPLGIR